MDNRLSVWANNIAPSPTLIVDGKAKKLKAEGKDVCGFGAGEPDFDTPEFIKEACIKAIKEGKTKYIASSGPPRGNCQTLHFRRYSRNREQCHCKPRRKVQLLFGNQRRCEPRRRSHNSGAVLGELSGNGEACRRQTRVRFCRRRYRL